MTRLTIATFGPRRATIRVFREAALVRVQWREHGALRTKSWPDTPAGRVEAKAWAKGFAAHRTLGAPPPRLSTRALWERYWASESVDLRPRSQLRYRERWGWWERYVGRDAVADDVTIETVGRFRRELEGLGKAVNQVRLIIGVVRIVYNWGLRARLLGENPLAAYRFKLAKDALGKHAPAEYRVADFERLLAQFHPRRGDQWRPWAVLLLLGHQGVRVNAALHLRWEDVDGATGELVWRARYDKLGREWRQAMRWGTWSALLTAAWHQGTRDGTLPATGWVFPPGRRVNRDTYRVQAFWAALRRAERDAGVPHLPLRAAHGLRRMVVNEILRETGGDLLLAADFVGDKDVAVVNDDYRRVRADRVAAIAAALDRAPTVTAPSPPEAP